MRGVLARLRGLLSWPLTAAAVALASLLAVTIVAQTTDLPPPLNITVEGAAGLVERGTTLGEVVKTFSIRAKDGDLLDVEGEVITPDIDPGQILVNGRKVSRGTILAGGDAITVIHGEDETEPTIREVRRLSQEQPENPQRLLGNGPVEQIMVSGEVSGKLVSIRIRAANPFDRPKAVALTFDDGPWPGSTRKILKVLKKHNVPATFFVIGSQAADHPELIEQELKLGMTVANHSYLHPASPSFNDLTSNRLASELDRTDEILASHGVEPGLFRPPGGSWDADVYRSAWERGHRLILWDVDPRDYRDGLTKDQVLRSVLKRVRRGSIVLMHDGGGDQSATVKALPAIIKALKERNYRMVALNPSSQD